MSVSYGEVMGLLSGFLWAVNSMIVRTQSLKVPPILMNALRCASGGLYFWVQLPFNHPAVGYTDLTGTEWALLVGSVVVGVTLGDTLYLWSIREMGISRTMALAGTVPLSTLVFERVLLGVPFPATFVAGCLLVAAGVACLSLRSGARQDDLPASRIRTGVILVMTAVVLWGVSTVMLRPAIERMTTVQANSVRMPLVAAFLFGAWRIGGQRAGVPLDRRTLLIVCGTGLLGMGIGSYFYLEALHTIGAARTAALSATAPLFAMGLAVVFLRETVTQTLAAGVLLCVGGVWLVL